MHDVPVNVLRNFELRVFGDNLLNQRYFSSDTAFDDQFVPQPTLRPGWAVFGDLTFRLRLGDST